MHQKSMRDFSLKETMKNKLIKIERGIRYQNLRPIAIAKNIKSQSTNRSLNQIKDIIGYSP